MHDSRVVDGCVTMGFNLVLLQMVHQLLSLMHAMFKRFKRKQWCHCCAWQGEEIISSRDVCRAAQQQQTSAASERVLRVLRKRQQCSPQRHQQRPAFHCQSCCGFFVEQPQQKRYTFKLVINERSRLRLMHLYFILLPRTRHSPVHRLRMRENNYCVITAHSS